MVVWVPPDRGPAGITCPKWPDSWVQDCGVRLAVSPDCPRAVRDWVDGGCTFVAHNAEGFDAQAWLRFGYGNPSWCDTMHFCRAGGYPAGLDKAAKAVGAPGKDEPGAAALKLMYTARQTRQHTIYPVGTLPLWENMLRYNIVDVLALRAVYRATYGFAEPDLLAVHAAVNSRGCPVDLAFAERLRCLWSDCQQQAKIAVGGLTDDEISGDDIRSVPKVKAWLKRQGLALPSLGRPQVEELLRDPDGFFGDCEDPKVMKVRQVILERQQAVRATVGKLDRLFAVVDPDSRVRDTLTYYGAHTGRFAGRDFQPHNMPRGVNGLDVEHLIRNKATLSLADMRKAAGDAKCSVGDALATLMRPVICAGAGKVLVKADYAAIEGRGVAWIARDEDALDVYRDATRDPYKDMASAVFGVKVADVSKSQRQIAKVIVLACGYQMGATKFAMSASMQGVDLPAVGLTAEECVAAYRAKYAPIVRVWRAINDAAEGAISRGRQSVAGRCTFRLAGNTFCIDLPSGRTLRYRNAAIVKKPPKWNPALPPQGTMTYISPHGHQKDLYGGLLTENIVQAISRDILKDAVVRLADLDIVMHIHDEVIAECEEQAARERLRYMCLTMSTPPAWAKDFPLRVEGDTGKHYTKSPSSTSHRCDAMNGGVIEES